MPTPRFSWVPQEAGDLFSVADGFASSARLARRRVRLENAASAQPLLSDLRPSRAGAVILTYAKTVTAAGVNVQFARDARLLEGQVEHDAVFD
jgi:hypothetical protein